MPQRGQDYILATSSDDGASYDNVGKLTNISLSQEKETISTNNFDSPDDAESIAGMKNWGISAGSLFIFNDAGQVAMRAAYNSVDPNKWKLSPTDPEADMIEFEGDGHVTSMELEFETNDVVAYSIDIEGTGVLTETTLT